MPARPPRTERVLKQEADHVILGEQLRHRPQVRTTNLALRRVDLVLLVFLPELVHPAKRIVGREHLDRQTAKDLLKRVTTLRRQPQTDAGIVKPEDAGQDLRREPRRYRPAVRLTQCRGQVLTILK